MSSDDREPYGAETFAEGNWYHELLEDGLALSYRVRPFVREREARARIVEDDAARRRADDGARGATTGTDDANDRDAGGGGVVRRGE